MIKKIAVRVGILLAVFIAALTGFSYLMNSKNPDMNVDMGVAVLPEISFISGDREINPLAGYTSEMEITSMRDTITPVSGNKLEIHLDKHELAVNSLEYRVYSLDGEECLQEETIDNPEKNETLRFMDNILMQERVLKLTLRLQDQKVNYYTRIESAGDTNYDKCLDHVEKVHEAAINNQDRELIASHLESSSDADNSGYGRVTIGSDLDNFMWGSLDPLVLSNPVWEIKESNETYTSVLLSYRVKLQGDRENEDAVYTVKEYFKVRIWRDKSYLLDYERTMDQFFEGSPEEITEKGIITGISSGQPEFVADKDGKTVCFIQNNELWYFNKETEQLVCLFSFSGTESMDERHHFDRHNIEIISIEEDGIIFTVSGYMNRGAHEGSVGVVVYEYTPESNTMEEKVFVPTTKGYDVMKEDLGKQVYYSRKDAKMYVMMSGTLYCVDMEEDTREVLVHGLDEGQYVMSSDGHLLAYQEIGGKLNESKNIIVRNFINGKSFKVSAEGDAYIKPIGFIRDDFVYGISRKEDEGVMTAGQRIHPMYRAEIVNGKGKVVKTYETPGQLVQDGYIEGNMLTLERVAGTPDGYYSIDPDYITNNEAVEEGSVVEEKISSEGRGRVYRLTFKRELDPGKITVLRAKQVQHEKAMYLEFDEEKMHGKYYVYSRGRLQGVYNKAGYGVRSANLLEGTVVSSSQNYVWDRGNLPNAYEVEGFVPFTRNAGESTLEACIRQILIREEKEKYEIKDVDKALEMLNLSGCTVDEILYTVSRETPVIAITGSKNAVLIIGYNKTNVAYLDPADGQRHSVTKEAMAKMVKGSGNSFIGYIR